MKKFNKNDPSTFKYNNEELSWVTPNDDIACRDCLYKLSSSVLGYTNGFCKKYLDTGLRAKGKPYDVLFKNAKCDFYEHE